MRSGAAVLVAYFFPPFNIIASQRALRMARVLLERHEQVYVVTIPPDAIPDSHRDDAFGADVLVDRRLRVVHARPLLGRYGVVSRPRLDHRLVGATLTRLLCSPGADWMPSLSAALNGVMRSEKIDVAIVTGGPFVPFVTVARSAQRFGVPLILDYRDLWSANPRSPYSRAARILVRNTLERYANARGDAILTVSNACRESLLDAHGPVDVRVVANTPDRQYVQWFSSVAPADAPYADRRQLHIALTGTVYPHCTCRVLLESLIRLPDETRDRVSLHYFGMSDELMRADARAFGLTDRVIIHGMVSKREAVAAVRGADLLLSLVSDDVTEVRSREVQGLMTTKIFDYMLSGRPIVNIGQPDSDLVRFVRSSGYDGFYNFTGAQTEELTSFLADAVLRLEDIRRLSSYAVMQDFGQAFGGILDALEQRA